MGQINNARQLTLLITPCEVRLYPPYPCRMEASCLCSAELYPVLSLRLHLHRECSREGEGNKLKHTLHLHHKRRCVKYVFSLSSTSLSATHGLSLCVKSSVVLALKKEEETVICVLLIIVQLRGCPVITHVCNYRVFVL